MSQAGARRPSPARRGQPRAAPSPLVLLVRPARDAVRLASALVAGAWTYSHRHTGGPPLDPEVQRLIVRLAKENPAWGSQQINGERQRLGVPISATAIRTTLGRHGLDPAPRPMATSWRALLRRQAAGILACDLPHRRQHLAATAVGAVLHRAGHPPGPPGRRHRQPDGQWVTQQARNLLLVLGEQGRRARLVLHDRDAKFPAASTRCSARTVPRCS
jgi:putative transposase